MLVVVVGGSVDGAEGGHQIGERVFGGGAAAVSVDVDGSLFDDTICSRANNVVNGP